MADEFHCTEGLCHHERMQDGVQPDDGHDYDVCLSFAGEQRPYVEQVANALRHKGVRVFYDAYEQKTLWGKDLYEHLDYVYRHAAKYCIIFISEEYGKKLWTNHERKSAQARALSESEEYVLPARFDDTELPGLRPTVGYIDLRRTGPIDLVELIANKVADNSKKLKKPPLLDDSRIIRPKWDPITGLCAGISGEPVIPGPWQVSAPRDVSGGRSVRPGQAIEIGLRKKFGQERDFYYVSATVFAPDGTSTRADGLLKSDQWLLKIYPSEFPGAKHIPPSGDYTIVWEVAEGFLACDGFRIEERYTFGDKVSNLGPHLADFEDACTKLLSLIANARDGMDVLRSELVEAVERLVNTRNHSRNVLSQMYGGYWGGDQYLHEVEMRAGVLAQRLDQLVENWPIGGGNLSEEQIMAWSNSLIADSGRS